MDSINHENNQLKIFLVIHSFKKTNSTFLLKLDNYLFKLKERLDYLINRLQENLNHLNNL